MANALAILQQHGETLTAFLREILAEQRQSPPRLIEAIEYSLLAGGKRLRPALVLESFGANVECRMPNAEFDSRNSTFGISSALAAAAAVELIHTFSLVHDDLPAMDDDDLRRGKPTSHKIFGEAMAILAGDAMVTMAFQVLADRADPQVAPKLIAELATAAGPGGMIGGQVLDIAAENRQLSLEQLQQIHLRKTAALLAASCRLGAIAASADDRHLNAVGTFGRHLGLTFQIIDDILDVTSTPDQLGKATRKDATRGKNTYPALMGIEASRSESQRHLEAALKSLDVFGPSADGLRCLAEFTVQREK